jgi:hypothetical protein
MAHLSDTLKTGDIALGRFAAVHMVDSKHREIGTRVVGTVLPAHPLLVLDVDKQKREATVMLLGSEKQGNAASQLGFTKKEQELAKLERQTVFKPHELSVMPLDKLYPNQGGHVSEDTMARIHKELARTIQDKTVTVTHLARDGTVSLYDMARERPGKVIMEAPAHNAGYQSAHRPRYMDERAEPVTPRSAAPAAHTVETVAHEAASVRRTSEIAEVAMDVAKFAAREGVKVIGGGPIGDAMAAVDLSMAAFSFVDNHTGHAISQGPIGRGVEYVGEHTGAFKAAHEVAEKVQPYVDQAHRIVDPVLDRVTHEAGVVADKTGLTAVANRAEHLAERAGTAAVDWSAQQIANVQKGFSDITRAAGFDTPPLTHEEAKVVAHGVASAQPGEAVALHHSGSMELLSANANHVPAQPGTLILDAQAFKEQMGLSTPTRAVTQVAQAQVPQAAPAREMMH